MPERLGSPTGDGRRTRWDAHRVERRRQLVDAGLEILEEVGPEFGVDQVADRAGVTRAVVYRHFTGRADLVEAIGERATEILVDDALAPVIRADAPLLARVRTAVGAYVRVVVQRPVAYRFFRDHTPASGEGMSRAVKDIVAASVAAVIAEAVRAGDGDSEAPEVWAHGLVGFVQNVVDWWLDHRTMSAERLVEQLTGFVWDQMDGFARRHGVRLDPDARLDLEDIARQVATNRGAVPPGRDFPIHGV